MKFKLVKWKLQETFSKKKTYNLNQSQKIDNKVYQVNFLGIKFQLIDYQLDLLSFFSFFLSFFHFRSLYFLLWFDLIQKCIIQNIKCLMHYSNSYFQLDGYHHMTLMMKMIWFLMILETKNFFKQFESIFQWHCVMCCLRQTQRWIELKYRNKSVFHLIPKRWFEFEFEFELNAFMLLASSTHMHHYPFCIIYLILFLLFLGPFLYFRVLILYIRFFFYFLGPFLYFRVFLDLTSNLQKYIRQKIIGYFYSRSWTLYTNFWTKI